MIEIQCRCAKCGEDLTVSSTLYPGRHHREELSLDITACTRCEREIEKTQYEKGWKDGNNQC